MLECRCIRDQCRKIYEHRSTTEQTTPPKKSNMLANPNIKRRFGNIARGSRVNAKTRLRWLAKFC